MGEPFEKLAPRQRKGTVVIWRGAKVAIATDISNARITGHIVPANGLCPVARGVVADDHLKICNGLGQNRFQRSSEEVLAVVYWQAYANLWLRMHVLSRTSP